MSLRSAVFYFSWDGNTAHLASSISSALTIPAFRLVPEETRNSTELIEYVWEDKQIRMPELPRLRPIDDDPTELDLVFLGSPIWKGTVAPPVRSFLEDNEFTRKRFALFCSYSGRVGGYFRQASKLLVGNDVVGTMSFREPLSLNAEKSRKEIAAWAEEMLRNAGG